MRTRLALPPLLLSIVACSASPYSERIGTLGDALAMMTEANAAIRNGVEPDRWRWDLMRITVRPVRTALPPDCATEDCYFRLEPPPPIRLPRVPSGGQAAALAAAINSPPAPIAPPAPPPPATTSGEDDSDNAPGPLRPPPPVCRTAADGRMAAVEATTASQVQAAARPRSSAAAAPARLSEREIYRVLREYGEALKAISNAKDREDFDKAAGSLAETAGQLAGTVGSVASLGAGAAIGPVVAAAVSLIAHGHAQVLERRRYNTLREALIQTCIPIRTLVVATGLLSEAHRRQRISWNEDTMEMARVQVNRGGTDRVASLERGQGAASSLNTLRVDPRIAARRFVAAHDRLVVAVTSGEDQSEAVLTSLTEFVKRADELRRATEALP